MAYNSGSRTRKDASQKEQEKYQKMLEQILKLPGNDNCADCGQKGPRWASINLGIFVCIRCSGIHRSMGTHISKVKSVSLDKWQPEMVEQVRRIGNINANRIYEGKLPANYHRPREGDSYAIEQWIHDKYNRKRWYDSDAAAEIVAGGKLDASPSPQSNTAQQDEQRRLRREQRKKQREQERLEKQRQQQQPVSQPKPTQQADLLGMGNAPTQQKAPTPVNQPTNPNDFFAAFQTPSQAAVQNSGSAGQVSTPDDFFAAFQSPSQPAAVNGSNDKVNDFFASNDAPASSGNSAAFFQADQGNKKDAIMSLFKNSGMSGNSGNMGNMMGGNMNGGMMGGNMNGNMMGGNMNGNMMGGNMNGGMMGGNMNGNMNGNMMGGNQMRYGNQMMGNQMNQGYGSNPQNFGGQMMGGNQMNRQAYGSTPQNNSAANYNRVGNTTGFQW